MDETLRRFERAAASGDAQAAARLARLRERAHQTHLVVEWHWGTVVVTRLGAWRTTVGIDDYRTVAARTGPLAGPVPAPRDDDYDVAYLDGVSFYSHPEEAAGVGERFPGGLYCVVFFRCNNDDALAAIVDLESGSVLRYERPCQVATGAGEVPCIAHQLYRCVAGQIVSGPCFGENDGAVPVLSGPEWGWPDWKVWALDPESILRLDGERAPPGVRIREQDPTFFHLVIEDEASLRQAATPPPVTDPPDWVWVPHGPYPDKASFPHYTGGLLDFWFDPRARTSSLSRALDGHLELLIPISWTWHHDGWLSSWSRPRVQSIAWHDAAFDLRSRGRSYTFRESDTACDWDFPAYAWSYD